MSSSTQSEHQFVDMNAGEIQRLLDRVRPKIDAEDYDKLDALARTVIELARQVRDERTTIARLRRLFGLASSEKTADVLGDSSSGESSGDEGAAGDGEADGARPQQTVDDADGEANGDGDGDRADGEANDDGKNGNRDSKDRGHGNDDGEPEQRPGHGRLPASAYAQAERIAVSHQSLKTGDGCPECSHGKLYPLPPARLVRIVGQPPLAAKSWDCQRLRCSGCQRVFTAQAPDEAQGPKYDESAAAMMAILRYGAGMPLNRLERLQSNLETPVPSSTQWEVVRDRVDSLRPVYVELVGLAANADVLHNDDTRMLILELTGKRRAALLAAGELPDPERTGLFTTGVVASTSAGLIALFFTGRQHAGENIATLLAERNSELAPPIQMCDGLDRNLPKGHQVRAANCLAHGRRHIVDEVDNFPDECRHVLLELGTVFKNDETCRKLGLTGQERLGYHQEHSAPVMGQLHKWLKAQLDDKLVEPNSGLGQAYRYLLDRWDRLTLFLRVRDAPIDNNVVERALKMAIRHRNNSLFYRSKRGAEVGDLYMTLIYSAELHGENPFDYLTALLRHEAAVAEAPAAWLPWTYRATLATLELDDVA